MSVYASTPAYAERRRHPKALLLIVGGHVALIGAVMTARMAVPIIQHDPPIIVDPIPIPPDPPPNPEPPQKTDQAQPPIEHPYVPPTKVPVPTFDGPQVDTTLIPMPPDFGPVVGTNPNPTPVPKPPLPIARTGPRFITPNNLIEPPYPDDKRRAEEETTLRLKLSIDERGRVVAVEPLGRADRSFLEAARRHLLANWRYKPATEDGKAVASSTVITLTFRLE